MHNFSPHYLIPPPPKKKKEEINKDYNRLIYRKIRNQSQH